MKYGCIGEKLSHSFSAEIHAKLFDYQYELKEIPKDELDEFMIKRDFIAINVTIPYKQDVIPHLYEMDETSKAIGAVNTIVNKNGRLYGYNTDFLGMCAMIERAGIVLSRKKCLILGSGGTSKTAFAVAKHLGAREILRVSRSAKDSSVTYEEVMNNHRDAEIIINTTPCGMYPNMGEVPIDTELFENLCGVVDAIYNPLRSQLILNAKKRGIKTVGGLYMLVAQAAFAAEKFTETHLPKEKIDSVYRELVKEKQNIVLTGMPGCGKSTIGKQLARDLNMRFIDTDNEIINEAGCPITEIFASRGEAGFRDMETNIIKRVSALNNCVISTGGGAVLRQENTDCLRANGRLYFIDRPLEWLTATDDRPLSNNRADLEKRYNERYDIYCNRCDKRIIPTDEIATNAILIKEDFLNEDTCD